MYDISDKAYDSHHNLADEHVRDFVRVMQSLVLNSDIGYDLIISPGNSGAVMTGIAEMVFRSCGQPFPLVVSIPILRGFDNRLLLPYVKLPDGASLNKILFIDDEIGECTTAVAALTLLTLAAKEQLGKKWQFDVVAQQRSNFDKPIELQNDHVRFFTYAKHIEQPETNFITRYFRPPSTRPIHAALTEGQQDGYDDARTLNVALNVLAKDVDSEGSPFFTVRPHRYVASKLSDIQPLRERFRHEMRQMMVSTI